MNTGTLEQLAATLIETADPAPTRELAIMGTPGDWSVAVVATHGDARPIWLAATRRPSVTRCFKTLDAAHAAAVSVALAADPTHEAIYITVGVTTPTQRSRP
jgi:hypothetical protein